MVTCSESVVSAHVCVAWRVCVFERLVNVSSWVLAEDATSTVREETGGTSECSSESSEEGRGSKVEREKKGSEKQRGISICIFGRRSVNE